MKLPIRIPDLSLKVSVLIVVALLIVSVLAVSIAFPNTVEKVKEKIKNWIKVHIIDGDTAQKIVDDSKADPTVIVDGQGTGLESYTLEDLENVYVTDDEQVLELSALPTSIDLSASPYFPVVGNQGVEGSCAAWAIIYYAYGYMEAKQYGWTDASTGNPAHLLSPAFTFNRITSLRMSGTTMVDGGSSMSGNVLITKTCGVSTLATMPYVNRDYLNMGSITAQREALYHEASSAALVVRDYVINTKTLISNDVPVTFGIDALQYNACFNYAAKDFTIDSTEYNNTLPAHVPNHAQCVVGYNDAMTFKNGDVGGFKVVNSWGTGFADKGYYWISYKAYEEMCDSIKPTYVVDKKVHNPKYVAELDFSTIPTRDGVISFTLKDTVTGATYKTITPYMRNTFYYDVLPKYSEKFITDVSDFTTLGSSNYNLLSWSITNSTIPPVLSLFILEKYSTYNLVSPDSKLTSATNSILYTSTPSPTDTTPPVTTISISGITGSNGWYSSATFKLSPTDASGISTVMYKYTGMTDWAIYTSPKDLPNGIITIEFYSVDNKGNTEAVKSTTVSIDNQAPSGTSSVTSSTTYTVTLSGTDSLSGVSSIYYNVDGGSWILYSSPIVVTGTHTISYYIVDIAGVSSVVKTVSVG